MSAFDIRGISKPKALKSVCDRAQSYIATMALLGKPAARVSVSRADYIDMLRAANTGRDEMLPEVDELRIGDVPVVAA